MLNSHGDIGHHCLTPLCTLNHSDVSSPTFTAASLSWYRPCIALNSLPCIPYCFKASHRPALHTQSYAFSRSRKAAYNFFPLSSIFSLSWRITNTFSAQPLPGLNSTCSSIIFPSVMLLILSLITCHADKCPLPKTVPPDHFRQEALAITGPPRQEVSPCTKVEAVDTVNKGKW